MTLSNIKHIVAFLSLFVMHSGDCNTAGSPVFVSLIATVLGNKK